MLTLGIGVEYLYVLDVLLSRTTHSIGRAMPKELRESSVGAPCELRRSSVGAPQEPRRSSAGAP